MALVAEASGAWAPDAARFLAKLSRTVARRSERITAEVHKELLERLSVIIRRAHARALLRRVALEEDDATDVRGTARAVLHAAEAET